MISLKKIFLTTLAGIFLSALMIICIVSCKKSKDNDQTADGEVKQVVETQNGITYKLYTKTNSASFKGILIMGSGNNESNPSPGSMDGAAENDLCKKAAQNGYASAIVQYRKTPGLSNWDLSAQMVGEDYDKCIKAIAAKYGLDKNRSVIGGYSYASYMLLTNTADRTDLAYCKGLLAPCGATDATYFHLPIYSIVCSGNNEDGGLSGKNLYNAIRNDSPYKSLSEGITDNSCNTHCGGNWTDKLYTRMVNWLQ